MKIESRIQTTSATFRENEKFHMALADELASRLTTTANNNHVEPAANVR